MQVGQFASDVFHSAEIGKRAFAELKENEATSKDPIVEVGFDLGEQYEFRDQEGRAAWPKKITVVMGYKSNYRSLDMKQVTYDDQELAVGGFFDKSAGHSVHVAFNAAQGELIGTVEVSEEFIAGTATAKSKKILSSRK